MGVAPTCHSPPTHSQVSEGLQGRPGPKAEAVCLLCQASGATRGQWGTRGLLAKKVSDLRMCGKS